MTGEPSWVPEAIEDLQAGIAWYDERVPGLGPQLAVEVFEALDQAVLHPFVLKRYEHVNLPADPGRGEYTANFSTMDPIRRTFSLVKQ